MFSQKLSDFIENYHQKTGFSGVIRITKADEIIHSQSFGYADKENKIPFTNDSMFTFYSLSKPFCAIAMMRLFDLGKDADTLSYILNASVDDLSGHSLAVQVGENLQRGSKRIAFT